MAESFTNYAPGSSPIWRIDLSPVSATIVPIAASDIQIIGEALEQHPPILHEIENSSVTVLQQISSLRTLATRLKKNELISVLFLQRLATHMTDKVMQERLEEARNMMRNLGIENVGNVSDQGPLVPRYGTPPIPTPTQGSGRTAGDK